jgi:WD40 repeat protein/energy-coupling factor transporter ATP-binding protein EcfA2
MAKSLSIRPSKEEPEEKLQTNPYPGLRPFNLTEKHLYYGREGQSERILELLTTKRFVAIIGPSGCGKSSLINCGIIPQLYGGYLYEAGSRWKIARMHPGYSPIESLSITLTETFASQKMTEEQIEAETNMNYVLFTKKALEISSLVKKIENYKDENILIFIDQFEELFRFTAGIDRQRTELDESLMLINLLIEALKQKKVPVYVVICIRSDFVGSCSNYEALTEYINLSHYLVPQMGRDSYRSAILGPLSLTHARISPDVLQEILNNVGDRADQLPVLQHLMMRLYNFWNARKKIDQPISIYDYKAVGGLAEAISLHSEELFSKLDENEQETCKRMFQTITESGGDNKGIRRPTSIRNIIRITKAPAEQVFKITELFRAEGNSIITPDHLEEISEESVLDISHEAVMRNWKRLKGWIEEESDAVQLYLRLVEASQLYQSGKTGPWRPPELYLAINWRDKFKPNEVWASQYHPAYARALRYLEVSEASFEEEEAEKERAKEREIRRTRLFAVVLAIAAVIAVIFMFNSINNRKIADRARQEAEVQRELAEENALEAEKQKNLAMGYAAELEVQKAIVEANYLVASDQRDVAVVTADRAVRRSSETEQDLVEVSSNLQVARKTTNEALQDKARAEQEKAETFRENMILLAQSLAINSLEIKEDADLQALIAYQAYKFNSQYNGPVNQASIYVGLRKALTSLDVNFTVKYKGHTEAVRSMVYAPRNGWLFTAGSDGRLIRWNKFTGDPEPEVIIRNNTINRIVAISQDEKWLACGAEGTGIQLFNLGNPGTKPQLLNAHQNRARSIAFLHNNREMLTSGTDNTVLRWNLSAGSSEVFRELESSAQSIAISSDDQKVAIGTRSGKLLLFNLQGDDPPIELRNEPGNQILSVVFKKNNVLITGDQKGIVRIWYIAQNEQVFRRKLHQARINEIQLDPSERYIATSSTDGSVYVLDLENLNQPAIEIANLQGFVYSVAFINNGNNLVIGSNTSNPLFGQPVRMSDLAGFVCPNVSRNLSKLEWNNYIGRDIPFEETCK